MLSIPLQPLPSQTVNVTLAGQNCMINVYQKFYGLFCDLFVNTNSVNNLIIGGVLCLNNNFIVRSLYLGFNGDLAFTDTQPDLVLGPADPSYTGLSSRFVFLYAAVTDLPPTYGLSS